MNYHLLKRNPTLNLSRGKKKKKGFSWFVQTKLNGNPAGSNAHTGETIFFYEVGYAVWGIGQIVEITNIRKLKSIEEVLNYILKISNLDNTSYWGDIVFQKVWQNINKKKFRFLGVFEIKADIEILNKPFVLPKKYNNQASWQVLEKKLEDEHLDIDLNSKIPSTLRFMLFNKYNLEGEEHYFDIDHVVPSSLGGPGNIEENLVPVAFGINRYKSNKVPKGLFVIANKYGLLKRLPKFKENYLSDNESKNQAKLLVSNIHKKYSKDIGQIRKIYNEIKRYHYPNLLLK